MDQHSEQSREKSVSQWLMRGFASMGCGALGLVLGPIVGAAIGSPLPFALAILAIVAGIFMVGLSILTGIQRDQTQFEGDARTVEGAKILNKYAFDNHQNLLTDDYLIDGADGVRFYMKIELAPGNSIEFETAREVYDFCGEGLRGTATFQGKWLSQFVPHFERPPLD